MTLNYNQKLVLDVGCGINPRGDINLDLYLEPIHRQGGAIDPELIQNFVEGDALDMWMFKDREIDTVKCYHLIEHFKAPQCWDLLKELWRITDRRLLIVCPHRSWLKFPKLRRSKNHLSHFDSKVFKHWIPRILGTHNFEVETEYRGLFSKLIPFPLVPYHLKVQIWK